MDGTVLGTALKAAVDAKLTASIGEPYINMPQEFKDKFIFPIAEARQGYEKLKQVYKLLGKPDNIDADFFDGPHSWSNNKSLPFVKKHFGK